jgi:hypothetical protein
MALLLDISVTRRSAACNITPSSICVPKFVETTPVRLDLPLDSSDNRFKDP